MACRQAWRRRAAREVAASGSRGMRLRVSPPRTCGFTSTELREAVPPRAGPNRDLHAKCYSSGRRMDTHCIRRQDTDTVF
eukprot:1391310-Prymnesium_polylepis.1